MWSYRLTLIIFLFNFRWTPPSLFFFLILHKSTADDNSRREHVGVKACGRVGSAFKHHRIQIDPFQRRRMLNFWWFPWPNASFLLTLVVGTWQVLKSLKKQHKHWSLIKRQTGVCDPIGVLFKRMLTSDGWHYMPTVGSHYDPFLLCFLYSLWVIIRF